MLPDLGSKRFLVAFHVWGLISFLEGGEEDGLLPRLWRGTYCHKYVDLYMSY